MAAFLIFRRLSSASSNTPQQQDTTILSEMQRMWSTDPRRLPIPADLPRLARRMTFQSVLASQEFPGLTSAAPTTQLFPSLADSPQVAPNSPVQSLRPSAAERRQQHVWRKRLADAIMCSAKSVRQHLITYGGAGDASNEEVQRMDRIVEQLQEMTERFVAEDGADGQVALMAMLSQSGAYESAPLMGLFRLIQQRAIYTPAFRIKGYLREQLNISTKDTHGPDAWRILIDFSGGGGSDGDGEGNVVVTHTRRERSAVAPGEEPESYFEVEWSITLVTDRLLSTLLRADLRLISFIPDPQMPDDLRHRIHAALDRCCSTPTGWRACVLLLWL